MRISDWSSDVCSSDLFKWPLIESALVFDRRLHVLDATPERYLTSERKDVSVDFFAVGMIEDVRAFYRATGGAGPAAEEIAVMRLAPIIKDSLRNEINSRTLSEVVSGDRSEVIERQLDNINVGAKNIGIRIVDLRIKKIDLPTDSTVIRDVYRRSEEHTSELQSLMRISYADICLTKKNPQSITTTTQHTQQG